MPKQTLHKKSSAWRTALVALFLIAAVYVLAANWQTVRTSIDVAKQADLGWLVGSLVLTALTFLIAAAIYGVLAIRKLRYQETVIVEVSTAFVNRLLPSGIGGLGLHGVYLYKRKHSAAEATVVVTVNNLIGMLAHLLLLTIVCVFEPSVVSELLERHNIHLPWIAVLSGVILVSVLLLIPAIQSRLLSFGANLLRSVRELSYISLLRALGIALLLTLTYTLVLMCSARSIDIKLGLPQIFIVFSVGMLASTATPTPGGLVGAEAGLFAGFVAYGVPATNAAAAVLLFRLATYWLPLIPGVIALWTARKRKLV